MAQLQATKDVLKSSDHYRAKRYRRLLNELAEDPALPLSASRIMGADLEDLDRHIAKLAKKKAKS